MKHFTLAAVAALSTAVSAFPRLPNELYENLKPRAPDDGGLSEVIAKRAADVESIAAGKKISENEGNCGLHLCVTWSEKQYVSTTGAHAYASPAADEIRGPCPGLNAASNHGYLPRDGVASIPETIFGLGEMYGMSVDLGGFLAAYAIALDGDLIGMTWSIGGPQQVNDGVLSGILSPPQGISYSHNKYEGDTSIGRDDAYMSNGDAHSLHIPRFLRAYSRAQKDGSDRYTLDKFRQDTAVNQQYSIKNNPYYFAPLFSTTLVAPAAYNFIINFMSNHSKEEPAGYLNGDMFKTFFGVAGDYDPKKKNGGLSWLPGQERLPENWYKRPFGQAYDATDVFKDLAVAWAAYPDTFRFGGNTGKKDSYVGVDIATLTGGTFDSKTIFEGNNFACLLFMTQQQAVPDQLKGLVSDLSGAMKLIDKFSKPLYSKLACPKLAKYDSSVFNKYPGRNYSPKGNATNY